MISSESFYLDSENAGLIEQAVKDLEYDFPEYLLRERAERSLGINHKRPEWNIREDAEEIVRAYPQFRMGYKLSNGDTWHHDAEPTISAVERALTYYDPNVVSSPSSGNVLTDGEVFPIDFANDPLATTYNIAFSNKVGEWQYGAPRATNVPNTEAYYQEMEVPTHKFHGGYVIQPDELAIDVRTQLTTGGMRFNRQELKRQAFEEGRKNLLNKLIAFGYSNVSMPGCISHPGILKFNLTSAITSTTAPKDDKAILEAGALFSDQLETSLNNTAANRPDSMLISLNLFNILNRKTYTETPAGGTTVTTAGMMNTFQRFLLDNPHIKYARYLDELEANQVQSNLGLDDDYEYIIFFQKDVKKFRFQMLTPPLLMMPPITKAWNAIVNVGYFSTAGAILTRLTSIAIVVIPKS